MRTGRIQGQYTIQEYLIWYADYYISHANVGLNTSTLAGSDCAVDGIVGSSAAHLVRYCQVANTHGQIDDNIDIWR